MHDTDMAMHTYAHTHTHSRDSKSDRDGKRSGLTSINVLQMGVNPLLPRCDYCFLQGLVLTPSLTFLFSSPPSPSLLPKPPQITSLNAGQVVWKKNLFTNPRGSSHLNSFTVTKSGYRPPTVRCHSETDAHPINKGGAVVSTSCESVFPHTVTQ